MGEALPTRYGGIGQWQKALRMLWEAKQRRSWSKVTVLSYFVGCVFLFLCPIFLGCCQFPAFDFYALFSFCHRFLVFILLWEEKLLSF